jgi:hypothetical protein
MPEAGERGTEAAAKARAGLSKMRATGSTVPDGVRRVFADESKPVTTR